MSAVRKLQIGIVGSLALVLLSLFAHPAFALKRAPIERATAPIDGRALEVAKQIDQLVQQKLDEAKIPASGRADDAEFLRRLYVDILGKIPTAEQAEQFLDSRDPDKRRKLIDQLLDDPAYGTNQGTLWHNWIVMPNFQILRIPPDSSGLLKWLASGFNTDRSWDTTVSELLTVDGSVDDRPWAVFYLYCGTNYARPRPNVLAASTARLFLGTQLQCCECHDHPYRDWKQADFWGLASFFGHLVDDVPGGGERGHSNSGAILHESHELKAPPESDVKSGDPPFIEPPPGATIRIPVTSFRSVGKIIPAKFLDNSTTGIPDQAPFRPALAKWLTSGENKQFALAYVNRLWSQFFGRGFVNPIDDFDGSNPASHPELLKLLADEFTIDGFRTKHLVRCICNSAAYQRTSQALPENKSDKELFSHMQLKVLRPEVLYDSLCEALELPQPVFIDDTLSSTLYSGTREATPRDLFCLYFSTKDASAEAAEFSQGIPQALVLMNARSVSNADADTHEDVVERLTKAAHKSDEIIEDLFLASLSRRPTPAELTKLKDYLARHQQSPAAYRDVLWSLINRSEFAFCR